jgi:hypothetical protein
VPLAIVCRIVEIDEARQEVLSPGIRRALGFELPIAHDNAVQQTNIRPERRIVHPIVGLAAPDELVEGREVASEEPRGGDDEWSEIDNHPMFHRKVSFRP